MSQSDPNCLLSVLWGRGSAVALNNSGLTPREAVSNTFIKAMKNGAENWDSKDIGEINFSKTTKLAYAHLAVSPRDIIEAEKAEWKSGAAVLRLQLSKKQTKRIRLDTDKKIFESIQKNENMEWIMKKLRESELSTTAETAIPSLLMELEPTVTFKEKTSETGLGKHTYLDDDVNVSNVGPSNAMKRILSIENEEPFQLFAGGNIPLLCADDKGKKDKDRKRSTVPVFRRVATAEAYKAITKQKDLLECLRKDKNGYNLLPYMEDIFVLDWYSIIERHLFRIHCSGYGERKVSALDFQKLGLFNMYKEKMHQLMRSLFGMKKTAANRIRQKVKRKYIKMMWYDRWIQDYRAELKEEEERPDKKYKLLRMEMVHKKYDEIRRRQRLRPPTNWLRKHKLIVC